MMNTRFLKKYAWMLVASLLPVGFMACSDSDEPHEPVVEPTPSPEPENEAEKAFPYVNFFGYNMMNDIYLWKQDITSALSSWTTTENPIDAVAKVRYKDASGTDVDKWTMMTDDYDAMVGGTNGESSGTYGCNYKFYLKEEGSDAVVAFVTFTYPGSPAQKVGLQRGDVVLEVNGVELDKSNYTALYYSSSIEVGVGKYLGNGAYSSVQNTLKMDAVAMYENPVLMTKVFQCGAKKVGYLVYTSFTFESCIGLYEACKQLKAEGISELILDLRYNGGGYVFTENVLASMLAPADVVKAGEILSTEVWNDEYMAYFKQENEDLNTYFQTEFKEEYNGKVYDLDTSDANLGLSKIYALVGEGTASASESILVCLMPYMDIEVIGEQTHGKYCSGIMQEGEKWYQNVADNYKKNGKDFGTEHPQFADWKKYITNWGLYVMISMYADRDGNNPCMPDGLTPDEQVVDRFEEPYALGDERELMLNIALQKAGKTDIEARGASSRAGEALVTGDAIRLKRHALEGERIYLPADFPMDTHSRSLSVQ